MPVLAPDLQNEPPMSRRASAKFSADVVVIAVLSAGDDLNLGLELLRAHHDIDLIKRAFGNGGID